MRKYITLYRTYPLLYCKGDIQLTSHQKCENENKGVNKITTMH